MSFVFNENLKKILPFLILVAGAYLLYSQMFSGVWLVDDMPVIVDNPDIRSLSNFWEDYYPGRPLRELTYLVDYHFFGLEPSGYYIQNIFWHGFCAWLVFVVARQFGLSSYPAWFASLLFLLHPVHVEVVANNSHRKDSLALAFCLLAVLAYLHVRKNGGKKLWLLGSALCWGVALSAKQNALALPIVFFAYEIFRLPENYRLKTCALVTFSGLSVVAARVFYLVNDASFGNRVGPALYKIGYFSDISVKTFFLTVVKAWAFMASKLIWPSALTMEYTFSPPVSWFDPWVLCGGFVVLAPVVALFFVNRLNMAVYLSLVWYVSFWLPTSNLVGNFSYFAADRYWYAPSVGLFFVAAFLLAKLLRKKPGLFVTVALVLLLPMGWQTLQQQKYWCDTELFYAHMQSVSPSALGSLIGLGNAALERGDLDQALVHLKNAERQGSQDPHVLQSLGYVNYLLGRYDSAVAYFKKTLMVDPKMVEAYNNLGSLYDDLGQPGKAIDYLQMGLKVNPHYEQAYTNLGVVYERQGELKKAEEMHRRSLRERPDYGQAHFNLGTTLYMAGRKDEALSSFAQATSLMAGNADAFYNYALVAHELGRKDIFQMSLETLKRLDKKMALELENDLD